MTELTQDSAAAYATALLSHYGFELGGYTAQELVAMWLHRYRANWVRLAAIEALYQGRYKAVSVGQILATWTRRGRPIYHFNHEFERLISRKIPQNIAASPDAPSVIQSDTYELAQVLSEPPVLAEDIGVASTAPTAATTVSLDTDGEALTELIADVSPETADAPPSSHPDTYVKEGEPEVGRGKRERVIYEADWGRWDASKRPIHQFMPTADKSECYLKLKAVADCPRGSAEGNRHEDFLDESATKGTDRPQRD